MDKLRGEDGCCFGNPCYNKACLACFCRGNIKYLTTEQARCQDGKVLKKEDIEFGDRTNILTDEDVRNYYKVKRFVDGLK
jgi:hypothetical protein